MVNLCLRRQMPELYGGREVPTPELPQNVRYGNDNGIQATPEMLPEGIIGSPDVIPLDAGEYPPGAMWA